MKVTHYYLKYLLSAFDTLDKLYCNEFSDMRILIADDSPDSRFLVARPLKKTGHSIIEFDDGFFAYEFLQQGGECDLIFSDTNMPKMDGYTFVRQVKKNYAYIPVVMMTSTPDSHWVERCTAIKADYCLLQPKDGADVLHALEQVRILRGC